MNRKVIISSLVFLIIVAFFGATVVLSNNCLRALDVTSPFIKIAVGGTLLWVYYTAWRWICRKLDNAG